MSDYRDTLLEMKAEALRCKASSSAYAAALLQREADAIDALLAELTAKDAALAEERAVTAALRTMVLATEQSYYSWGAAMSESYAAERDAAVAARVKPRIAQVEQQARAAHGAKEQA